MKRSLLWIVVIPLMVMATFVAADAQEGAGQGESGQWHSFGESRSAQKKPTQVKSSSGPASMSAAERTLFELTNRARMEQKLKPLKWSPALADAARTHAKKMAAAGTISHQFPGEMDLSYRVRLVGVHFTEVAENVAQGPSAAVIQNEWMQSPHHRENILDPDLSFIGIGVVTRNGELFAVQDFDKPTP
jgi:uncharacterized protein YkwD